MSTNDVPGFDPKNNDELAALCWAEHEDGSLIFVESTEAARVVYSMFDMRMNPPIEYRDAMPESGFKKSFSWDEGRDDTWVDDDEDDDDGGKTVPMTKWTWHDKTPFPWDRIIKAGITDGPRIAAAEHVKSAAERIAESIKARGEAVSALRKAHRSGREIVGTIGGKLKRALHELRS